MLAHVTTSNNLVAAESLTRDCDWSTGASNPAPFQCSNRRSESLSSSNVQRWPSRHSQTSKPPCWPGGRRNWSLNVNDETQVQAKRHKKKMRHARKKGRAFSQPAPNTPSPNGNFQGLRRCWSGTITTLFDIQEAKEFDIRIWRGQLDHSNLSFSLLSVQKHIHLWCKAMSNRSDKVWKSDEWPPERRWQIGRKGWTTHRAQSASPPAPLHVTEMVGKKEYFLRMVYLIPHMCIAGCRQVKTMSNPFLSCWLSYSMSYLNIVKYSWCLFSVRLVDQQQGWRARSIEQHTEGHRSHRQVRLIDLRSWSRRLNVHVLHIFVSWKKTESRNPMESWQKKVLAYDRGILRLVNWLLSWDLVTLTTSFASSTQPSPFAKLHIQLQRVSPSPSNVMSVVWLQIISSLHELHWTWLNLIRCRC